MFVRDGPAAIDFAQADREAKIQSLGLTIGPGFRAMHRCNDESDVAAGGDVHLGNIEWDRVGGPGKEQIPGLLVSFDSPG
jgi:hypothetical protein